MPAAPSPSRISVKERRTKNGAVIANLTAVVSSTNENPETTMIYLGVTGMEKLRVGIDATGDDTGYRSSGPAVRALKEEMIDRAQRCAALVFAITFPLSTALMVVAFTRFLVPILVWNEDAETGPSRWMKSGDERTSLRTRSEVSRIFTIDSLYQA
jgi:hypothetical protein